MTQRDFARKLGIAPSTVCNKLQLGMSPAEIAQDAERKPGTRVSPPPRTGDSEWTLRITVQGKVQERTETVASWAKLLRTHPTRLLRRRRHLIDYHQLNSEEAVRQTLEHFRFLRDRK